MDDGRVEPTRKDGQPDLLPQKSQGHQLHPAGCDDEVAVKRGKHVLVARLAHHDNRRTRDDSFSG